MNKLLQRYKDLGYDFNPDEINIRQALRVNTLKINEKDLIKRLQSKGVKLEKIPFLKSGYYFEAPFSLSSSEEYLLGYIYIQETASQLPAELLLADFDPTADHGSQITVLDLCAAPGSKTTQLAQLLNNKHSIVAVDDNSPRLETLQYNLERLGIENTLVFKKDGRFIDDLNLKFDYILLDAPCSGNFCIEENFFKDRSLQDFKEKAKVQQELLRTAYKVLKKGGTLVYSTCSLEPEEDEETIAWFVEEYKDMQIQPIALPIGDNNDNQIKLWPHKTNTQGFFMCKLIKNG